MRPVSFTCFVTAAIAAVCTIAYSGAQARELAQIRSSGTLRVGVYKDFPPYSDQGTGIDVELGHALAERLGVAVDVRAYDAGENMDDDLRNIVWKGNFLGLGPGPSDVMVHVPVDPGMSFRNPQVKIFAPYHRETMAVIRTTELLPKLDAITDVTDQSLGVETESIMSFALLSSDAGRLREQIHHFHSPYEAQRALEEGRIAGFFGLRSQVEPIKAATGAKFVISTPPPLPGLPQAGWALGLAVEADNAELAQALQDAIAEMARDGTLDRIFGKHAVTRMAPL
ncbi:MAG: transporter substrate-binding domain-containing protein [Methyloversatilis sp.]|nr:transporter substrate-binding domain-containing protein [Methyloversatilis sp.]